jgi:2-methylisocitrate lyase-like PEP mutase family enzyme
MSAAALRALHRPGDPLVLVNVWDAVSARTVAAAPGCRAIATASWSIAAAHGFDDGERLPLELMLAAIGRVAAAVDLPVSADLEGGYGDAPETVARAMDAGAVGGNLEDRLRPGFEDVIAAVRARAGDGFVINARTDELLLGGRSVETAIERGRAFLAAGADCVFVPGAADLGTIRALVEGIGGPVSVFASPASPPIPELAAAGVARISFGPGPMGVAHAALGAAAATLLGGGAYPAALADRP